MAFKDSALKDLLLLTRQGTEAGNRYALWLADMCGARLTVTSPAISPALPPIISGELPGDLLSRMQEEIKKGARGALDAFLESAQQTDVTVETLELELPSGDLGREVGRLARYFDATVLEQSKPEGPDTSNVIEAVLFGSGRPALIVPYIHMLPQLRTVLVAWNEGRPATRAIADALPLLQMADRVEIVTVLDTGPMGLRQAPADMMARHLAQHGVNAAIKPLAKGTVDVGNTLVSYAVDVSADLIVMGAYGHSRLREIVLGGTTRTILQSMTVPVLMAH
ncbi:universal stress protein [Microvirga yunnanensis]|uniref:universal stress protein n=1 Tax=Microvirga yunnanensis TaxID=2953740 RepID=UPI0021C903C8|nr:universal stress protein [Microvirga sp. HBU65207]